jgi:hypothetical protein
VRVELARMSDALAEANTRADAERAEVSNWNMHQGFASTSSPRCCILSHG